MATTEKPRVPSRGNSYPLAYYNRARELYGAGWTNLAEVARMLERELGRKPNPTTIRKWVDPDYYESVRMRERTGGVSGPNRFKTWKLRLERMRELREKVGLSFRAIADLMSHDFEVDLTAEQAERILTGRVCEGTTKRLLWPQSNTPERSTT